MPKVAQDNAAGRTGLGSREPANPYIAGLMTEMRRIAGASFQMGSNDFYPEERPAHSHTVADFDIDLTPVTNAEFAEFTAQTGYVTTAERPIEGYPELSEDLRAPGSIVFTPTSGPVDLSDWRRWWSWVPGASWRHPGGPGTSIEGLDDHPVVQVSYFDACEFAVWADKRLPTEAEFEYAAGCGATTPYAWGDERDPDGRFMANTYRGRFPYLNSAADGWRSTSPVGYFPANSFGLYDTIGNVWEWTSSYYTADHHGSLESTSSPCCGPSAADLNAVAAQSAEPGSTVPRRVIKGGSHLCAPEYCHRYRPSARSPQAEDSSTSHIGFRCVRSV